MTQGLEQDWSDLLYNSTDDGTLVGTSPTPPPPPPPPDLPPPTPQTRESAVSGMETPSLVWPGSVHERKTKCYTRVVHPRKLS